MNDRHDWERRKSGHWWCETCDICGGDGEFPADVGSCAGVSQSRDECDSPPRPDRSVVERVDLILDDIKLMCDAAMAEHGTLKKVPMDDLRPLLVKHLTKLLTARVPESIEACARELYMVAQGSIDIDADLSSMDGADKLAMEQTVPHLAAVIAALVDAETQKARRADGWAWCDKCTSYKHAKRVGFDAQELGLCDTCQQHEAALAKAVEDEREACAKLCEAREETYSTEAEKPEREYLTQRAIAAEFMAAAIRTRNEGSETT